MSYTVRSPTTLMPRFACLEFLDILEQITVVKFYNGRPTSYLFISFFFIAIIMQTYAVEIYNYC